MSESVFDNNVVTQVGIIVKDIEKSSEAFAKAFGIEKPQWVETGTLAEAETEYKGNPTEARAKLAFMRFGSLDIELIEPDEHPSTWREFLDEKGEGIHHLALVINGMKAHIGRAENAGFELVQKGEYPGGRYAYIDAGTDLKMIVELLEND